MASENSQNVSQTKKKIILKRKKEASDSFSTRTSKEKQREGRSTTSLISGLSSRPDPKLATIGASIMLMLTQRFYLENDHKNIQFVIL